MISRVVKSVCAFCNEKASLICYKNHENLLENIIKTRVILKRFALSPRQFPWLTHMISRAVKSVCAFNNDKTSLICHQSNKTPLEPVLSIYRYALSL